jgi:cytochrome P450
MDGSNEEYKSSTHPTIFHELLNCELGPEEKTLDRLTAEGQTVVAAGSLTTAQYLQVTFFHLLSNPEILRRLKSELAVTVPNPDSIPPSQKLEQLPYLSAVICEGFRISLGTLARLTRVAPDRDLVFNEWTIPAGTPIGMSSTANHTNPELFPDPQRFDPERWLNGSTRDRSKEKYLVNFSKGTRACLGINLAQAEIHLTIASVVRRFELELFETTRDDVEIEHDFFNPFPRLDSKGVQVLVN